eukprot:jgi/Phyca11/15561/fgenesh1_pg.PHYCAscaffold_14_\
MLTPSDCQCGHAHGDEHEHDGNEEEDVQNPLPVLIAFVITNTIFVTVGGLCRLLAQLLTLPGFLVVLSLEIVERDGNLGSNGRSTTVDSAALEAQAAAKPKPAEAPHPLVTFAVAKAEQVWIPGYKGHQVDAMLMPPVASGRDAVDRPVIILCNPNGGLYELHHLQMDWIKFYTSELDCHVLVYNYRGYGRCKGSPSPAMHNLDGIAIVNYLHTERNLKRIAVHGESIGGLVATYLARHSPHVNVLIADLDWVMRWETDNVQNYLEATCAKLLCSDPSDEIILDGASLKSGVALSLELDDKTFSLPRQRETDGSPALPVSPTNVVRKIRTRRALEYTTRRDKEESDGHSKSLEEAAATNHHLVEQYPPLKFDYDIGFVVLMIEYLNDALERRWRHLDSSKTQEPKEVAPSDKKGAEAKPGIPLVINTGDAKLGWLLPLHCGHNKNYEDTEKQALIGFLRHVGG